MSNINRNVIGYKSRLHSYITIILELYVNTTLYYMTQTTYNLIIVIIITITSLSQTSW